MSNPILLLVDDDADDLRVVEQELRKRYGADYQIISESAAQPALRRLEALQTSDEPVALLIADCWMPQMTGIEFLDNAHPLHPQAKRLLLIHWGDTSTAEPILQGTTLGWIDAYAAKPVKLPDEHFHKAITDLLHNWSLQHVVSVEAVQIIGERWSARSYEIRDLLARHGVPFGFYETDSIKGQTLLHKVQHLHGPFPIAIIFDGRVLVDPSNQEIADALGANARVESGVYDLVIVGSGPAGLSAAVYGASEGLRTGVVEREAIGGQAGTTSLIRNYLGFPMGISGKELTERAYGQAWLFGAKFYFLRDATGLRVNKTHGYDVLLSDGSEMTTRAVLLTMGASYRRLEIPSLEALVGVGVFYGGAVTEALALKGMPAFVVGAGNSAGQAAIHMAKYAKRVTIVARGSSLSESMSEYLVKEIAATDNITVRLNTRIMEGHGVRRLEALTLQDTVSGKTERLPAAALFALIGALPHTDWLPKNIMRDQHRFILTGEDLIRDGKLPAEWPLSRTPLLLETGLPGVFAAGDVRYRSVKRVASAVGEGGIAIQLVHEYISQLNKER